MNLSDYVPVGVGLVAAGVGGAVLLRRATAEVRMRRPGPMTLRSAALAVALVFSLALSLGVSLTGYWWQLAATVVVLLVAVWLETSTIARVSDDHPSHPAVRTSALVLACALGVGAITAVGWLLAAPGSPGFAVERLIAVLLVVSPAAALLAAPLVDRVAEQVVRQRGLIVRDSAVLDAARRVEVVLLDKSGTLTQGHLMITDIVPSGDLTEDDLLRLAAAVERKSEHPTARAIVAEAESRGLPRGRPSRFAPLAGRGVTATIDKTDVTVSSVRVAIERGILIDPALVCRARDEAAEGKTVVYVLTESDVLGLIALADPIRPEAIATVLGLRSLGVRPAILTGHSLESAKYVASRLGIDEVYAELLPDEKPGVVAHLQRAGTVVAVVGDPATDAAALRQADVGISLAPTGDSAGIVLPQGDPCGAFEAIALGRVVHRKKTQNIIWAVGYHAVAVPIAAGLLWGAGVSIAPALAAALSTVGVLVVALNSASLKHLDLGA